MEEATTTPTPPKVKMIEEILAVLDDNVHYDPAELGCNWDLEDVKAYLRTAIIEVLESVSYEVDNRYLTIKWLWNKEKTDTDKLFMVHKQMVHIKQLIENISKLKESK